MYVALLSLSTIQLNSRVCHGKVDTKLYVPYSHCKISFTLEKPVEMHYNNIVLILNKVVKFLNILTCRESKTFKIHPYLLASLPGVRPTSGGKIGQVILTMQKLNIDILPQICALIRKYVLMYVCLYSCTYACTHVNNMCACMHARTYVMLCMYVHMYIYM